MNVIKNYIQKYKNNNENIFVKLKDMDLYEIYFDPSIDLKKNFQTEDISEFLNDYNFDNKNLNNKIFSLMVLNFSKNMNKNSDFYRVNQFYFNKLFNKIDYSNNTVLFNILEHSNNLNQEHPLLDKNKIEEIIKKSNLKLLGKNKESFLMKLLLLKNEVLFNCLDNDLMNYILKNSDLSAQSQNGSTPLMLILKNFENSNLVHQNIDTLNFLLQHSNLNDLNNKNENALMISFSNKHLKPEHFSYLINNSDLSVVSNTSKNVVDYYIENRSKSVIDNENFEKILFNSDYYFKSTLNFLVDEYYSFDDNEIKQTHLDFLVNNSSNNINHFNNILDSKIRFSKENLDFLLKKLDFNSDLDDRHFTEILKSHKLNSEQKMFFIKNCNLKINKEVYNHYLGKYVIENFDSKTKKYFKLRKFISTVTFSDSLSKNILSLFFRVKSESNEKITQDNKKEVVKVLLTDKNINQKELSIDYNNLKQYNFSDNTLELIDSILKISKIDEVKNDENFKSLKNKMDEVLLTYLKINKNSENIVNQNHLKIDELVNNSLENIYENLLNINKKFIDEQISRLKVLKNLTLKNLEVNSGSVELKNN